MCTAGILAPHPAPKPFPLMRYTVWLYFAKVAFLERGFFENSQFRVANKIDEWTASWHDSGLIRISAYVCRIVAPGLTKISGAVHYWSAAPLLRHQRHYLLHEMFHFLDRVRRRRSAEIKYDLVHTHSLVGADILGDAGGLTCE